MPKLKEPTMHRVPVLTFLTVLTGLTLSACAPQRAALVADFTRTQPGVPFTSPAGQLFCQVNTVSGPMTVGIVTTVEGTAIPPPYGVLAVIATRATVDEVNAECAAAGGKPVVPPLTPVGNVAIPPAVVGTAPTMPLPAPGVS